MKTFLILLLLASACSANRYRLIEDRAYPPVATALQTMQLSANNDVLLATDTRGQVYVGKRASFENHIVIPSGLLSPTQPNQGNRVVTAVFAPDGSIFTVGADGYAQKWDEQGVAMLSMEPEEKSIADKLSSIGQENRIYPVTFSPDGALVTVPSDHNTLRVWDLASGKLLHELRGHGGSVYQAAFSSDGTYLVTASADGCARVWDTKTGKTRQVLCTKSGEAKAAIFLKQDQMIAIGSQNGSIALWNVSTGQLVSELDHIAGAVENLQASANGSRFLIMGEWGTAYLWDATHLKRIASLREQRERIQAASFSPDGQWLLTTAYDGKLRIFDTQHGALRFWAHHAGTNQGFVSRDNRYLVSGSQEGSIEIWMLPPLPRH